MSTFRGPRVLVCAAGFAGLLASQSPAFAQIAPGDATAVAVSDSQARLPVAETPPGIISNRASSNIFSDLFGDFRHLASQDSARWLGIGATIALVGHVGDHQASHTLGAQTLQEPFESGRLLGGAAFQMGGAFATYAVGTLAGSSRTAEVGGELFRAQVLSETMVGLMKVSAGRSRPDGSDSRSFPSGHTAGAFASATVLQRNFGWKLGIPAYAVATYIGASRIQTQKHYLSDVAFGAALGILAGRTVTVGTSKARFAVEPFAVSGGGGVSFNLLPSH